MWESFVFTRRSLVLAVGALAFAGPAFAKKGDTPLPRPLSELGPLALTRGDGAATTLGAEVQPRRATVISLWATWCGPCIQEAQHLAKIRTAYATDQLDIIGINVEENRDEAKMEKFFKKGRVNFTQLRGDPQPTYLAFGGALPITLPRLYVFNRSGTPIAVYGRYDGAKTLKAIDASIALALSQG